MWRVRGPRALVDSDRTEPPRLEHANQLEADHFQQSQERHDHERTGAVAIREQILEATRLGFRQTVQELVDSSLDRDLLARRYSVRTSIRTLEHALERGEQAE